MSLSCLYFSLLQGGNSSHFQHISQMGPKKPARDRVGAASLAASEQGDTALAQAGEGTGAVQHTIDAICAFRIVPGHEPEHSSEAAGA